MPKLPRLKAIRTSKFMTIRELAAAADVSPATVARLEAQQVEGQFGTIKKLAAALGVAPSELVGSDGDR